MGTMVKKTSKQQLKQANAANFGDTLTPPAITTEPTKKTLPVTAPTADTLPEKAGAQQTFENLLKSPTSKQSKDSLPQPFHHLNTKTLNFCGAELSRKDVTPGDSAQQFDVEFDIT